MEDKLKVLIIGCGRVASKHIKAIKKNKERLALVGLVDVSDQASLNLLRRFKLPTDKILICKDYQEAITALKPDIVAVTVPSGLHYSIAEFALEHGCDLILEKPMTMSSSESKAIYDLSVRLGRKIAMGHIYRYFPLVSLLRDDIVSGRFGKITHGTIYVRWGHGDDYYNQAAWRGTWKADGGALMNQTIHAIDLLVWLMGTTPVQATAMISKRLRKIEAEDLGMAILRMSDGSLASIEGTTATSDEDHASMFAIFCENGIINLGLHEGIPSLNIRDGKGHRLNGRYICKQIRTYGFSSLINALNPHTAIYADLIDAIDKNREPLSDAMSGYSSVDTLMGIYKSALTGTCVDLPLKEDFSSLDMKDYHFD